jgi:hypothetical protein
LTFIDLLQKNPDKILYNATEFLVRSNLEHYNKLQPERLRAMLARLYFATKECVESDNIAPVKRFMEDIAPKRFKSGYELYEVQTAINILEESMWKSIVELVYPREIMPSLIKSQEILAVAKKALAESYVELENGEEI